MLRWIRVRNIAVIEELEVDFGPGLNLLTGETGAGKSILVDALGLVLGSKATAELVRSGASSSQVEAGFELDSCPDNLRQRLDEAGITIDEGEIIVRRQISPTGRGKVVVNGTAGTLALLRELAPYLADIHGQGENLSLLRPGADLELLDRLANNQDLREKVKCSFSQLKELENTRSGLVREGRDKKARQEHLEFQVAEIDKASATIGEDSKLEEERTLLVHAERLRSAADEAYSNLYEDESSVLERLASVWKRVSELAEIDTRLESFAENESAVRPQLEDLALFLRDYREQIRFTPGRLDEVEERLTTLERLKKKYGGSLEAVIAHRQECTQELEQLEFQDEQVTRLHQEIARESAQYLESADILSQHRKKTADRLQIQVEKELRSLAMEKARFLIKVDKIECDAGDRSPWRESGLDDVEFLFSANPGEDLGQLSRIASGGESSRFMLALKSVATHGESPKTLVFDEVDTGIEGRVADVVGEKLKSLSKSHQVVCITHLPQIASFADVHYRIEKTLSKGRTLTRVERLNREGRINEIARMIAGAVVTESARKHAAQLVSDKN